MLLYSLPDDKAKGKNRKKVKNCPHKSMELPTLLGNYDKPTDEQTDGYTGSWESFISNTYLDDRLVRFFDLELIELMHLKDTRRGLNQNSFSF